MPHRAFTAIAYDVADDRRRVKLARLLDGVADRVQESVFEGYLDDATLARTIRRVASLIDAEADTVRVYRLCATCRERLRVLGRGEIEKDDETIII